MAAPYKIKFLNSIFDADGEQYASKEDISNTVFYLLKGLYPNEVLLIPRGTTEVTQDLLNSINGNIKTTAKITHIPNTITTIGDEAFYECSNLTSVTIPDSVATIGNSAFFSCGGLTSITVPNSVTSIGWNAFAYCDNLASVTIGDSVTTIGSSAFAECYNLNDVTIGGNVENIEGWAFYNCDLDYITFNSTVEKWNDINIVENWCGDRTAADNNLPIVTCTDGVIGSDGRSIIDIYNNVPYSVTKTSDKVELFVVITLGSTAYTHSFDITSDISTSPQSFEACVSVETLATVTKGDISLDITVPGKVISKDIGNYYKLTGADKNSIPRINNVALKLYGATATKTI